MAKQDKETYESYAKDMFDNPPAGPMGVHRGARSCVQALPYVIVVIVALAVKTISEISNFLKIQLALTRKKRGWNTSRPLFSNLLLIWFLHLLRRFQKFQLSPWSHDRFSPCR